MTQLIRVFKLGAAVICKESPSRQTTSADSLLIFVRLKSCRVTAQMGLLRAGAGPLTRCARINKSCVAPYHPMGWRGRVSIFGTGFFDGPPDLRRRSDEKSSKNTVCRCGSRACGSNYNKVTSRLLNMQTLLARSRV